MADAEDSKSSVGNHVRVQVPLSAPEISPTVLRFLARWTLAVKSRAQGSRLTLAELWLFPLMLALSIGFESITAPIVGA